MNTFISLLGVTLTPICSVVVVILTLRSERNKKLEKAQQDAEQKARDERDKKIDDRLKALGDKLGKVDDRIEGVESSITSLQETDRKTHEGLVEISQQQCTFGDYIHELSVLVTVIAEGMRDQHLDGNVTNAVSAFRRFERDKLATLMTKPAVDD